MDGLSKNTRRAYLWTLIVVFVLVAPVLGLYAAGFRLGENFSIIKTGGIHVEVPRAGASFFLDDEYEGEGSLFQKNFFVQNLTPDKYVVRIDREGFHSWRKNLEVRPALVTESKALMLPKEPEREEIPQFIESATSTSGATGNPLWGEAIKFFDESGVLAGSPRATSTVHFRGATTTVLERGNIGLWKDRQGLHAWWLDDIETSPYFFCRPSDECERELLVAGRSETIRHFDFLPSDNQFVVIEWPDGIFATELDTRAPQNIQPIYNKPGASFRVVDGRIVILDDGKLYELTL